MKWEACRHAPGDLGSGSLCIPLAATGKSIGLGLFDTYPPMRVVTARKPS